jgi:hypothetical protein
MGLWGVLVLFGVLGWASGLGRLQTFPGGSGLTWRYAGCVALAACLVLAAARLGLGWSRRRGAFLAAVLCAPGILGFAASWAGRVHLPPPQDLPQRATQIWMALCWVSGVLACSVCVVLGLWRDQEIQRRPRWTALRLFGLCWLAYLALALWTAGWTATGDTPRYLMLTRALAERGSMDLKPEYLQRSWELFHDRDDLGVDAATIRRSAVIYNQHRPGLPAVLAPGWILLGPWGARWIHTGLAAAGAALLLWTALGLGLAPGQALGAFALFAFSAPWLLQSPGAMTELFSGLLWLVVLAAWARRLPAGAAYLAAGALPWVHLRFVFVAALLLAQSAWLLPRRRWAWLAAGCALAAGASCLLYAQFGTWSPLGVYQKLGIVSRSQMMPLNLPRGLVGIWLDQEYGWLVWAPAYFLAGAGLLRLWARDRRRVLAWLPAAVLYIVPVGPIGFWHGNMAPARFLVPLAPMLALLGAEAMDLRRSPGQRLLLAWTLGLGWLMAVLPWLCYSKMQGENILLRMVGARLGVALCPLFPSFMVTAYSPVNLVWAALSALALGESMRRWGTPRLRTP